MKDYNTWAKEVIDDRYWVGKINKGYGTSGELVIRLGSGFTFDNSTQPLWVEIDSLPVPLFVQSWNKQGNSKAVVVFDDFDSERLAARLLSLKVYSYAAENEQDDEDDESWSFLVGYTLTDSTSGLQGQIIGYVDQAFNPLLEVEVSDGQQHYIPIADELVEKISERRRTIRLRLPGGVFELESLTAIEDETETE